MDALNGLSLRSEERARECTGDHLYISQEYRGVEEASFLLLKVTKWRPALCIGSASASKRTVIDLFIPCWLALRKLVFPYQPRRRGEVYFLAFVSASIPFISCEKHRELSFFFVVSVFLYDRLPDGK